MPERCERFAGEHRRARGEHERERGRGHRARAPRRPPALERRPASGRERGAGDERQTDHERQREYRMRSRRPILREPRTYNRGRCAQPAARDANPRGRNRGGDHRMPSPLKVPVAHEKGLFAGAILVAGIAAAARRAVRLRAVRPDARRRCALSPPHAAGRADRPCGDRPLQARLHRLQDGPGPGRPGGPHGARVGDPHQPARPAGRLRAAVEALRGQRGARRCCRSILPDDWKGCFILLVMVFVLSSFPRQHRGGADRRRDGAHGLPRQGSHRLSGGDRRRLERRRRRAAWSATRRRR